MNNYWAWDSIIIEIDCEAGLGAHMYKEFIGGVLATWDRLFTKMISQRHHAREAQTHISILMVDAPYFYRHCLSYYISILIVFYNSCY